MSSTNESFSLIVEDPQSLLDHAEQVCQERLKEIRSSIYQEKRTTERELEQKQKAMEKEALEFCQKVKQSVLASMPRSKQCSMCQTKCKILVAECIRCNASDLCQVHPVQSTKRAPLLSLQRVLAWYQSSIVRAQR